MEALKEQVKSYWTKRAHDFGIVRKQELSNRVSKRWLESIVSHIPLKDAVKVLDVGTGTGFFAILLSKEGYEVHGIDLTEAMIDEAKAIAKTHHSSATFSVMDAQELSFQEDSFDVVVARNVTWTLPNPEKAYKEWLRVLKPGGVLLNFDADYAKEVRCLESNQGFKPSGKHIGMTEALRDECNRITKAMGISAHERPKWDKECLLKLGMSNITIDTDIGNVLLEEDNSTVSPLFLIKVKKDV